MDYGTGAVMGVPAHDQRDLDFALKFGLDVKVVVDTNAPITGAIPKLELDADGQAILPDERTCVTQPRTTTCWPACAGNSALRTNGAEDMAEEACQWRGTGAAPKIRDAAGHELRHAGASGPNHQCYSTRRAVQRPASARSLHGRWP